MDKDKKNEVTNEENQAPEQKRILTKKDLVKSWFRWINTVEFSSSFERLQSLSFAAWIAPILEKLYKDKDDLIKALKRHLIFFNTEGSWGTLIHGITVAMEEENAISGKIPDEIIVNLKTGFMGPMAGIGDTVSWGTIIPIVTAFFLPMAAEGSIIGAIGPLLVVPLFTWTISYQLFMLGYKVGRNSIMEILRSGKIKQIINFAGILGLFMMGVLSAQFVKMEPIVSYMISGEEVTLQSQLDSIIPGILPLSLVFLISYLITNKKVKQSKILIGILIFSLVTSYLGLF